MERPERTTRASRAWIAVIVVGVLLLPMACRGKKSRPENDTGPWISCAQPLHEFGKLYSEESRSHDFVIENKGKEPLEITDVQVQCGCTQPVLEKRRISPGESTKITIGFHPPAEGAIEKHIYVYSNDPYQGTTILTINAIGLGPAHLEPSSLVFTGEVPPEGITRDLELTLPEGESFADVKFDVPAPWMSVEVPRSLSGRVVKVRFLLKDLPAPMSLRESIQITVTSEKNGFRRDFNLMSPLQVTGDVRPSFSADPPVVHFGAAKSGTTIERAIVLHTPSGTSAPKTAIDGLDGATLEKGPDASTWRVRWTVPTGSARKTGTARFDFGDGRIVAVLLHGAAM